MLEAISLTKVYEDGTMALDALDLWVDRGEIYCLLGANGAGKTTTIDLFLGFIPATSGIARVNGIDVEREPLRARRHLAYVPENVMLYGNFTARENLDFFARVAGQPRLRKEELYATLARSGLEESCFERPLRTFSKGMRQKLGLAIAIVKGAEALLLDEPTSGLDPRAAADFLNVLRGLQAEGRAILMSTHDIFRAKEIADRIGIMRSARLVVELDREAFRRQDLQALYLSYMTEMPVPAADRVTA